MKNQHPFQSQRRGFTLIELLVVIAIIAILATILFPVFARARENARRSACMSNMKQTALGFLQYVQDYDERFPYTGNGAGTPQEGWGVTIQPYIKSVQLLQCPSETRRPPANPRPYVSTDGYTDYYYNSNLDYVPGTGLPPQGVNIAILKFPANTTILGDGSGTTANYGGSSELLDDESASNTHSRHLGGNNYNFCDGHAKWFPQGKMLGGTSAPLSAGVPCSPTTSAPTGSNATFCL